MFCILIAEFAVAPVKSYDRCVIQSETDYGGRVYPSVSNIVDFLRCSITYPNVKEMINGLKDFINKINNKEIECLSKIMRIKNGFENVLKWTDSSKADYCDIKLNVIYNNKNHTQSMIIEIQLIPTKIEDQAFLV